MNIVQTTITIDGEVSGDAEVVAHSMLDQGYEHIGARCEIAWELRDITTDQLGEYEHEFEVVFAVGHDDPSMSGEVAKELIEDLLQEGHTNARACDGGPSNATIFWTGLLVSRHTAAS